MDTVKKAYPRTECKPGEEGNDGALKGTQGWKLNKFHELLHMVRCIGMFGPPEKWIASHGERHHIDDCKRPAATAQKQHDRFTKQVAERLVDQMVIEKAKGEYFLPVELNAKRHAVNMFPGLVHNGQLISGLLRTVEPCNNNARAVYHGSSVRRSLTSLQVYLSRIPPQYGLLRRGNPSGLFEGTTNISPYLTEFVRPLFLESHTDAGGVYKSLQKFTNLQLHLEMVSEDELFRAHFNYRREGSWHDWVNVQRKRNVPKGGVQTKVEFANPGRVLLFATYHGISFHPQQQEAQSKEPSGDDNSVDS